MNHGPYVVSAGSMTTVLKVKFKLTEIHFHSIQFSEEFAFADTLSTEPPSQSLTAWCVWGGRGGAGGWCTKTRVCCQNVPRLLLVLKPGLSF